MDSLEAPLFVFEMANNHQGSVAHGKRIIEAMANCAKAFMPRFRFAVKFQYRDLETFIHPHMRGRDDVKNIKRFEDTRISIEDFRELFDCVKKHNMLTMCTPFDEASAVRIKDEGFDIIKIASCSFADWPLMEAMAETCLPVIASAAGSNLETIHKVISFFQHRRIPISLMHCVGEYPTPNEHLQMNQIDVFRKEFPDICIGFSTHEAPSNMEPVKIAVAKGARIFEKHVGVPTETVSLNAYSANPEQVTAWLETAAESFDICGTVNCRYQPTEKEMSDLAALRRGVFVKQDLPAGAMLDESNMYYAFPCQPRQLIAQDISKYVKFTLKEACSANAAVMKHAVDEDITVRPKVVDYVERIVKLLKKSNAVVPMDSECELSHHYGLEKFPEVGLVLISCVNREYCKKLLVLLPGQTHPSHHHVKKEETFIIVHGDITVRYNGSEKTLFRGDTMTVERGIPHSFYSKEGCVFEEISSTHFADDSFYEKQKTFVAPRKTKVYLTKDVLG